MSKNKKSQKITKSRFRITNLIKMRISTRKSKKSTENSKMNGFNKKGNMSGKKKTLDTIIRVLSKKSRTLKTKLENYRKSKRNTKSKCVRSRNRGEILNKPKRRKMSRKVMTSNGNKISKTN